MISIQVGFLNGNFGDEINSASTAERWQSALEKAFPGAYVTVGYQDGEGSKPQSLKTRVWDGDTDVTDDYYSHIAAVLENVEAVYAAVNS